MFGESVDFVVAKAHREGCDLYVVENCLMVVGECQQLRHRSAVLA
jgi:hypothetical protein